MAAPAYRRSTGTRRSELRRAELLDAIVDDLAANGLVDFSLRRAAAAAGTTHKVLLYHFDGVEEVLLLALRALRTRRVGNALAALDAATLAERVAGLWPVLRDDSLGLRVIDQAIGLSMYDPDRYRHLAQDATQAYLGALERLCPPQWAQQRRTEVAMLVLATMRGLLVEWQTTRDETRIAPALQALIRAMEREQDV